MQSTDLIQQYKKYRWFYTSSGKLVLGGKNSLQNDQILKTLKHEREEYIIMHTSQPGSPFSVILSDPSNVSKKDLDECAIFTACFSQAWKSGRKNTSVDVFKLSQIFKTDKMKEGTWAVRNSIKKINADLKLVLTKQKEAIRAVPYSSVKNKKEILLHLSPGKVDKRDMIAKIQIELKEQFNQDELLSALPSGGIRIN